MYTSALAREITSSTICVKINRKPEKNISDIISRNLNKNQQILITFGINIFDTTGYLMSVLVSTSTSICFALPGESRLSIIRVKMNDKTSINFIYPNLWAPTAGLLQDLTAMQQCVYQMKFRNICEVNETTGTAWIGLEQNIIDTAVNEW